MMTNCSTEDTIPRVSTHQPTIFPLLWLMLFDQASLTMVFPILTLLFFDLDSRLFSADTTHAVRSMWYGLCISVPSIVNVIVTPMLSALSDEFGRKKLLILGTLGAVFFALIAAGGILYGSLSILFLSYVIRGAFSRTDPIAIAAMGDISPGQKKVLYMGYLQASISIGAFVGPVIGGYFARQFFFPALNFSLPFFIAAIFALVSCLLTLFIFKETQKKKTGEHGFNWQSIKKVFANRRVLLISLLLLLCQITWSTYYQFIPPTLKVMLNVDTHQLGLFIGMIAFWLALATTLGIRWLEYFFNLQQILMISLYLMLVGTLLTVLFFFLNQVIFIWIAAIPTAVGDVIAFSCMTALYADSVEKRELGKVMGVCFIVISLVWSSMALLGGAMMSLYTLLPLIVAPMGIVGAIALLHFSKKMLLDKNHQT